MAERPMLVGALPSILDAPVVKTPYPSQEIVRNMAQGANDSSQDQATFAAELQRRVAEATRALRETNAALAAELEIWRKREKTLHQREIELGLSEANVPSPDEVVLRESERRSRNIIDGIPGFVATLAASGQVEAVNRQIVEYTGRPLAELRHWGENGIVHPDDVPHVAEVFRHSIQTGAPYEIEQRLRRHDGTYRWFANRGTPDRDEDGKIVRWYVLLIDVHERRLSEEALRASEREARLIVSSIPAGIAVLSPAGDLEAVNDHIADYFGKTEPELKRQSSFEVVHPDDLKRAVTTVEQAWSAGQPYNLELRLRGAHGNYRTFQLRACPLRSEDGRILRWYVLHIDIDDRKRAEDALRASEINLRKIINTLPTIVWSTLPDGYCDFLSRGWLDYAGLTAEEAEGWGWGGVVHPDDQQGLIEYWQAALASGVAANAEARLRRHDGEYRWFLFLANPLRDESGRICKWYGANIDIEDRKRAEHALGDLRSELTRMSRVSSLGVLAASIAHEVNQPLSGIITNTTLCLRMLAADPPNIQGAIEATRRTMRDGNRAADVVARLRSLFSKKNDKSEAFDLDEALAEILALATRDLQRNGVVLRVERNQQLPLLFADRVQIQQVILNLLLNASDAMSTVTDRQRLVVVRTSHERDNVTFSVRDVGVGFAAEESERLFDAFFTTKTSGMGIGLLVSRSIIESHGGRLWGEPNEGPGATFFFTIPHLRR